MAMARGRDIKYMYMDWKRFRNLRVPENHPCCAYIGEFAVDSDEYDMDADPSGRVSGV